MAACLALIALGACQRTEAQGNSLLREIGTIPLPGVKGRIDHLAFDATRGRLFVAALANNTVEVIDAARLVHLRSLAGFQKPQGVALVPELGAIAVSNGDTGTVQLLDAEALVPRWSTDVGADADNVRYDSAAKRLYVAADGGLYAVEPQTGQVLGKIAIDGHPESFQLDATGRRAFTNLPGSSPSAVIASERGAMTVTARWMSLGCDGNYPMALGEPPDRVFIACRRPARISALDAASGALVASMATVGAADDLFYDGRRERIYVIGGEGFVDVLAYRGDRFTRQDRVSTRAGARTGLWVASQSRLYVALPDRDGPAEIRVFEAQDGAQQPGRF